MKQQVEVELQRKNQELDLLRRRVRNFKAEFKEMLEQYKYSLESVKDSAEENLFVPSLIDNEKERSHI
jgi:hypothetical protein